METIKIDTYTDLGDDFAYARWLEDARIKRDEAELEIIQCVLGARAQGMSWESIAVILGISKQAAQQKFSRYEAVRPVVPLFQEPTK